MRVTPSSNALFADESQLRVPATNQPFGDVDVAIVVGCNAVGAVEPSATPTAIRPLSAPTDPYDTDHGEKRGQSSD